MNTSSITSALSLAVNVSSDIWNSYANETEIEEPKLGGGLKSRLDERIADNPVPLLIWLGCGAVIAAACTIATCRIIRNYECGHPFGLFRNRSEASGKRMTLQSSTEMQALS